MTLELASGRIVGGSAGSKAHRQFLLGGFGLKKLSLLAVALISTGMLVPCYAIWHCGDIGLPQMPTAIIQDPISREFWIGLEANQLARVDEATSRFELVPVAGSVNAMAFDPARRLLYATHRGLGLVTSIDVGTFQKTVVGVGDQPISVVVDPVRGTAFVACRDSTVFEIRNGEVISVFACPAIPMQLAADPKQGMVFATLDSGLLLKINPSSGDTTLKDLGSPPGALEIDPVARKLYIAMPMSNSIKIYSIEQDSLITLPLNGSPKHLALNPETSHLFVTQAPNLLAIIDTPSLSKHEVELTAEPTKLSIDPLSDRCFVSLPTVGLLVEVNGNGDTLLVSAQGQVSDLIVNPVTNKVYALKPSQSEIGVFEAADYRGIRVAAGGGPGTITIDMKTHKVYIPNWFTANVTVINGFTNQTSKFKVADGPEDVVVNPITGDIYTLCAWGNQVTIKKPTGDTLNVPTGLYSHGIALNPNTSKLYVSNRFSDDITIIDLENLDTTLVKVGAYPCDITINLETNIAYAPNRTSWSVVALDGAMLTTRYVKVGPGPTQVRLNPYTNMIYSVDSNQRSISAINGETLERRIVPVGTTPRALSINPNTNTLYVSSGVDGEIAVIDGATYRSKPVKCGSGIFEVRVDQYLDKAYTVSWDYPVAYVIDGNFLKTKEIPVGNEPHFAAYDPALEKLYISNHADNSVEIINLREKITPKIAVSIQPLPGDTSTTRTPTITGFARSSSAPNPYGIMKVLYKIDNLRGKWNEATIHGSGAEVAWTITTEPLLLGSHLIFVVAIDSTACSLCSTSSSSLMGMSDIACYQFTCLSPPPQPPRVAKQTQVCEDGLIELSWEPSSGSEAWYQLQIAYDADFSINPTIVDRIIETRWTLESKAFKTQTIYWRVRTFDYPHAKPSAFSEIYRLDLAQIDQGQVSKSILEVLPNPSIRRTPATILLQGITCPACKIYDIRGRLVRKIEMTPTGTGSLGQWDFKSDGESEVSPGIYLVEVETQDRTIRQKIVLLN